MPIRSSGWPQALGGSLADGDALLKLVGQHCILSVTDDRGILTFVNDQFCEISGYTRDELIGSDVRRLDSGTHPPEFLRGLRATVMSGQVWQGELCSRARDGALFWANATIVPFADGDTTRYVAIKTNITQRKQAEQAILNSRQRYASLVQSIDGIVWEADARTLLFTYVSERAEEVLGYPCARWLEEGFWTDHIHPDDRDQAVQYCAERTARLETHRFEYRMIAADGRAVWLSDFVTVLTEDGTPQLLRGLMIDITAQKVAEQAERRRQGRLRLSVELARLGSWEFDFATQTVTVDDELFRLLRTTAEAEGGHSMPVEVYHRKFLPPEDSGRMLNEVPGVLATQDPHYAKQLEHRWIRADGTIGVVLVRFSILKDASGRTVKSYGVVQDITERKEAEDLLRTSTALLEQTGALAGVGGWELDVHTRTLQFTPQTCRIHDLPIGFQPTLAEAIAFYDPAVQPVVEAAVNAGIEFGTPWDLELPFITAQGRRILVRAQGEAERRDGRVVRVFGAFHDITERRQTEIRLKRLLQGESLLATVSQRFIDMDPSEIDGGVREVLQSVAEFAEVVRSSLFVYSVDGTRILNTHEWCADPADSQLEELRDLEVGYYGFFHQELKQHRAIRLTKAEDLPLGSAERRWVEVRGFRPTLLFPLTSRSRLIGVVGFYGRFGEEREFDLDVMSFLASFTVSLANFISRRNAEEERVFLERQLLQAQKMEAIGTLAGGIAHDFNNILGAIVGNVGLARMEAEMGKTVDDSLLEIERAAERAGALVQQILAFSRHQDHERHVIALSPVLDEAIRFVRATIPAGVAIETTLGRDVPHVIADPTQMHQILLNLCANAWHAMEDSSGRISVGLTASTLSRAAAGRVGGISGGRYACLTVSDTGRGMDEATLKRIFDPFFTTKTVGKGTGLGMSVVHGIVRSHNGGIAVTSEPGRGTIVKIYLPAAGSSAGAATEVPAIAPGAGERILLVDDEESIVRVMSRILERIGYRVTAFSSPQAALAAFRANADEFDIVITDFEMPEVTGLALARAMLRLRADVPIVLCSGRIREDAKLEAEALGVRHFLTKPCSTGVISRVLKETLSERRPV